MADAIPKKTPLWVRITLFASLAINILILGAAVGFLALGEPDRRADRDNRDFGAFYTRALSEEDRRALRRDFMAELAEGPRDRGAVVAEIQTTLDTLRATPFDRDAFEAAMAEQSSRRKAREDMGRRLLADRIAAMTDAERAAYADRIEARVSDLAERIRR